MKKVKYLALIFLAFILITPDKVFAENKSIFFEFEKPMANKSPVFGTAQSGYNITMTIIEDSNDDGDYDDITDKKYSNKASINSSVTQNGGTLLGKYSNGKKYLLKILLENSDGSKIDFDIDRYNNDLDTNAKKNSYFIYNLYNYKFYLNKMQIIPDVKKDTYFNDGKPSSVSFSIEYLNLTSLDNVINIVLPEPLANSYETYSTILGGYEVYTTVVEDTNGNGVYDFIDIPEPNCLYCDHAFSNDRNVDMFIGESSEPFFNYTGGRKYKFALSILKDPTGTFAFDNDFGKPTDKFYLNGVSINPTIDYETYISEGQERVTFEYEVVVKKVFSITTSVTNGGGLISSSRTDAIEGKDYEVTFTPNDGYVIDKVMLNETDVTSSVTSNRLSIENISDDANIVVTYELIIENPQTEDEILKYVLLMFISVIGIIGSTLLLNKNKKYN